MVTAATKKHHAEVEARFAAMGITLVPGKRNKMGNRTAYYRGEKYDSCLEAEYAAHLDLQQKLGVVIDWERQVPVTVLDGPKARDKIRLIVDFWVMYRDIPSRYIDAKGRILPAFLFKVKLWKRNVPHELWIATKPDKDGPFVEKQLADGMLPAWRGEYS